MNDVVQSARPLHLLMVDDDPLEHELVEAALTSLGEPCQLTAAHSGAAALRLLEGGVQPSLLLLDLNMPQMHGLALLNHLKGHPQWRSLPVVIFSTSDLEADVQRAYQGQASSYLVKSGNLSRLGEQLASLLDFWRRAAPPPCFGVS